MKDLLRVVTAGSVDDGKSTLLGRLLADTGQVPEDQLSQALLESRRRGWDGLDPSLLLDGLEDERAQGITIDVAYRYFATERRFFVLADAPGHARYTRNMATGAAGCDVALLLVDATRGVGPQTRRHAFIAALMGVRHVVVAVNKMDQVDWSRVVFDQIRDDFEEVVVRLDVSDVTFVPMSALLGDNVVQKSERLAWYQGPPLLEHLETMHIASDRNLIDLRFPVQLVLLTEGGRYLAGTLAAGVLREGDQVLILPRGEEARIVKLQTPAGDVPEAFAGQAITCTLDQELDVARGDVLVHPNNRPRRSRSLDAILVWMDEAPLARERSYLLRLGTCWRAARVREVGYRLDVETGHRVFAERVGLNDLVRVHLELDEVVVLDEFRRVRDLGSFILVDRDTHATAAAGVVIDRGPSGTARGSTPSGRWFTALTPGPDATERPSGARGQPEALAQDESRGPARIHWLGASPGARERAARLATELAKAGWVALRLDREVLRPLIEDPESGAGRARSLEAARLVVAAGAVPLVLLEAPPPLEADVRPVLDDATLDAVLAEIATHD